MKNFTAALILLLSIALIFPGVLAAAAGEESEIHITVMLDDMDLSLQSQVTIMSMPPIALQAGEEKSLTLPAGSYSILALWQDQEQGIQTAPAQKDIATEPGEVLEVTLQLEPFPDIEEIMGAVEGIMGGAEENGEEAPGMGIPPIPGMEAPPGEEAEFDPEKATEEELQEVLEAAEGEQRRQAFEEFYQRQGIAFLAGVIDHPEEIIREWTLETLYDINMRQVQGASPAEELMPEIVEALRDPHLPVQINAALTIAEAWNFPEDSVPPLLAALDHEDERLRASSAQALGSGRESAAEAAIPLAERVLQDESPGMRKAAVDALGSIGAGRRGPGGEIVMTAAGEAVRDPDPAVRLKAVRQLSRLKGQPEELAALAAEALFDSNLKIRQASADVLSLLDEGPEFIVPELVEALQDSDSLVRRRVLGAMLRARENLSGEALAGLVTPAAYLLEDEDFNVRLKAARVLQAAGPAAADALPALIGALSDEVGDVVIKATRVINSLGPESARAALPELLELLQEDNLALATPAAEALAAAGETAVPSLIELLAHDDPVMRSRAAAVLGWIGPPAEAASAKLTGLYRDETEDDLVRAEAYRAVEAITGEEPEL